jgi:uncharacterized protein (TIGR02147 family)
MREQVAAQKLLLRKLGEFQSKNPAFSVRAFARRLGLHASAANEILKGERAISKRMAERLADRLHLDPSERAEFLAPFPEKLRRLKRALSDEQAREEQAEARAAVLRLTADQFTLISDWVHFAILSLIRTSDAQSSAAWIGGRLGVPVKRAQSALDRLKRIGLIEADTNGRWKRVYARVNTPDDILNVSIQKSHLEDMELARESLLRDPVDVRDFTSITMPADPALLPEVKVILRQAQDQISALMNDRKTTEVYRLANYFFPLTKRSPK